MLTKHIIWPGSLISRRKGISHAALGISIAALALLWSFGIYDIFSNQYVVNLHTIILNVCVFSPLVIVLIVKNDLLRLCMTRINALKLAASGAAAAVLAVRLVQQCHEKIYYDIILSGRGP